jgi:hypothetical protein
MPILIYFVGLRPWRWELLLEGAAGKTGYYLRCLTGGPLLAELDSASPAVSAADFVLRTELLQVSSQISIHLSTIK